MQDYKWTYFATSGAPDANAKNAVQVYGRFVGRGNVAQISCVESNILMVAPTVSTKWPVDMDGMGISTRYK